MSTPYTVPTVRWNRSANGRAHSKTGRWTIARLERRYRLIDNTGALGLASPGVVSRRRPALRRRGRGALCGLFQTQAEARYWVARATVAEADLRDALDEVLSDHFHTRYTLHVRTTRFANSNYNALVIAGLGHYDGDWSTEFSLLQDLLAERHGRELHLAEESFIFIDE